MQAQENLVRISTRPLVLTVAVLSALAIGLVGVYTIQASAVPPATKTITFNQDRPGPDSPYRVKHDVPDPWGGHGQ
ncbi:MAG: hypothetical protein E6I69_00845 [Chloroflexi bacterium]|nr:MAG: hypothetical protein E6I69_00845 [Chloroflexota bacterium]